MAPPRRDEIVRFLWLSSSTFFFFFSVSSPSHRLQLWSTLHAPCLKRHVRSSQGLVPSNSLQIHYFTDVITIAKIGSKIFIGISKPRGEKCRFPFRKQTAFGPNNRKGLTRKSRDLTDFLQTNRFNIWSPECKLPSNVKIPKQKSQFWLKIIK